MLIARGIVRSAALSFAAILITGCGFDCESDDCVAPPLEEPGPLVVGSADCPDLSCLPCATNTQCAEHGPFIAGTCCAIGDPLEYLEAGPGEEVVDLEIDDTYAIACGGFGARISRIDDPRFVRLVGSAGQRCQRAAFGPRLGDGTRVFYLAHHGDTWVPLPFLGTYHIRPDGTITQVDYIQDSQILFEGLAWRDGFLYVAAHDGGIRVYPTAADGQPGAATVVSGLTNAWKLVLGPAHAYVADGAGGVAVLDLGNPAGPVLGARVATTGPSRDIDVHAGRLFVALGSAGVDVFDLADPANPTHVAHLEGPGSAQAVSAAAGRLAIASWSQVVVRDATSLHILAAERTRKHFEQDLGVAMRGDLVVVGEWEGLHLLRFRPGFVAPDIALDVDLFTLPPGELAARAVIVRNQGLVELTATAKVCAPEFSLDKESLRVRPGEAGVVELVASSPPAGQVELAFTTNDPDRYQSQVDVPIVVSSTSRIDVGDSLTSEFAFLDPSGAGQLDGLRGKVVVLAYFALF